MKTMIPILALGALLFGAAYGDDELELDGSGPASDASAVRDAAVDQAHNGDVDAGTAALANIPNLVFCQPAANP